MPSNPTEPFALLQDETVFNDKDQDILVGWFISDEDEDVFHAAMDEIFSGSDESLWNI